VGHQSLQYNSISFGIIIIIFNALGKNFPRPKKLMQIVKLYTCVSIGRKIGP